MRLDLAATCDAASKGQAAPVKVGRLFVATLRRNASAPRQAATCRDVCGTAAECDALQSNAAVRRRGASELR